MPLLTALLRRSALIRAVVLAALVAAPLDAQSPPHHAADAAFMRGMVGHHAQAVQMTALVATRTENADIRLLAERITVSQTDEIAWMERWLKDRKEPLPDPHAHHQPGHTAMPGMLTDAQMAELTAARGARFDRLFLQFMIQHHEGALVMVAELNATPGAGQEPATAMFASEVDSDQRMEIARMRAMLNATPDRE